MYPESEKVTLHKIDNGYEEFPYEMENLNVDPNDKNSFLFQTLIQTNQLF